MRVSHSTYEAMVKELQTYRLFCAEAFWEDVGLGLWNDPRFEHIREQAKADADPDNPDFLVCRGGPMQEKIKATYYHTVEPGKQCQHLWHYDCPAGCHKPKEA